MDGNCHFLFGTAVGIAFALNVDYLSVYLPNLTVSPEMATLFVLGGCLGGIFPDIDNPKSHMGKLSRPVSTYISKVNAFFGRKTKAHRGMLHDPMVYIILTVLSYFYFSPLLGFLIGCLSHVYLDAFNPMGVPCLGRNLRFAKIPSGSKRSVAFTWVNVYLILLTGTIIQTGILN
jgi:inner membrane protein